MKKRIAALLLVLCLVPALSACEYIGKAWDVVQEITGGSNTAESGEPADTRTWQQRVADAVAAAGPAEAAAAPDDNVRTWYEVFVYSFCDGDADGIGDFSGLLSQLDYIQYMGFNGIWLMPIHPSPTYHKYDVTDYYGIDPQYGTMQGFERLLAACGERGIDVIIDLVLNHTSVEHQWFKSAVQALEAGDENNAYVGYYNFAAEPGSGNWYQAAEGWYYEAQFWSGMPDLNLKNPALRKELEKVMAFWLNKGVAGFRLDAVKEFVSGSTADNVEILSWVSTAVKNVKPSAYIVAENWDTATGYYEYYASGVDSLFNFPFAAAEGYIAKTLLGATTPQRYAQALLEAQEGIAAYSETGTDAPFFTNHDTARAAGFLRRDESLVKMAWGMNLMQSGNAFVYYGEELGMSGSGKDENKRAPMYWSGVPGVYGVAVGPPEMEAQQHSFAPAMEQIEDEGSILQYVRKAVQLRGRYPAIARGSVQLLDIAGVGAVGKTWEGQAVILVYNPTGEEVEAALPAQAADAVLADWLSATGEAVRQGGARLTMPAYSIAVLEAEAPAAGVPNGDDAGDAGE